MADDFVDVFLRRWFELEPAPKERRLLLEVIVRQEFGGERVYIKKDACLPKAGTIGQSIARGATFSEACEVAGVSLRQGYRLAKRRV